MFIREKIIWIVEYILAALLVINAHTIWNFNYLYGSAWKWTLMVLYVLIILSIKEIAKSKKKLFILGGLTLFISTYNVIFIMLNGESKVNFMIGFLGILLGLILYITGRSNIDKKYSILLKISNLIVILAVISLYFYIFGSLLNKIHPTDQIVLTWGWNRKIPNYNNLYYVTQAIYIKSHLFIRNSGIFTEAPMYAFSLCIALITELFFRNPKKLINKIIIGVSLIILIPTIMTTLSTTAIGVMAVAIPLRVLILIINNIKKSKVKVGIGVVLLIVFAISGAIVGGFFLKNKIKNSQHNQYGSFAVRKDDFKVGYDVWKKNKILGCGFEQYQYVQQDMNFIGRQSDIGGSSGLMKVLPEGGLMLFMVYLIPFILAIIYGIKKRDLNVIAAFILVYILLAVCTIPYRYLMIYFLALGFSYALDIFGEDKKRKKLKIE